MNYPPPLNPLMLPATYNYIGVFLTLDCNLHCSYCINSFDRLDRSRQQLSGAEWLSGLNRLVSRPDLPLTLQGGEPTLHPDFATIVTGIKPGLNIDLLTNLEIDLDRFMEDIPAAAMRRDAPYASIRVSYHPEVMDIKVLAAKVLTLLQAGYSVGIWGVLHPRWENEVLRAGEYCADLGIDFRIKEFLGKYDGALYGQFSYPEACGQQGRKQVHCRTSELLIGPSGDVYRCHADLYANRHSIGHILDPAFAIEPLFRPCNNYGSCNPCDIKTKNNRFQAFGHTSVEIVTSPEEPT